MLRVPVDPPVMCSQLNVLLAGEPGGRKWASGEVAEKDAFLPLAPASLLLLLSLCFQAAVDRAAVLYHVFLPHCYCLETSRPWTETPSP